MAFFWFAIGTLSIGVAIGIWPWFARRNRSAGQRTSGTGRLPFEQLGAYDHDFRWRVDTQFDAFALYGEDVNGDRAIEDYRLASFSA